MNIVGSMSVSVPAAVLALLVGGCAPKTRLGPLETSHPASAEAPEAPVVEPAGVLRGSGSTPTAPEPAPETPSGHGAMQGGGGAGAKP